MLYKYCLVYLVDILIFSRDAASHEQHVRSDPGKSVAGIRQWAQENPVEQPLELDPQPCLHSPSMRLACATRLVFKTNFVAQASLIDGECRHCCGSSSSQDQLYGTGQSH
jgi:hypothetical protein